MVVTVVELDVDVELSVDVVLDVVVVDSVVCEVELLVLVLVVEAVLDVVVIVVVVFVVVVRLAMIVRPPILHMYRLLSEHFASFHFTSALKLSRRWVERPFCACDFPDTLAKSDGSPSAKGVVNVPPVIHGLKSKIEPSDHRNVDRS